MTMGPEPIRRTFLMSVRRGIARMAVHDGGTTMVAGSPRSERSRRRRNLHHPIAGALASKGPRGTGDQLLQTRQVCYTLWSPWKEDCHETFSWEHGRRGPVPVGG